MADRRRARREGFDRRHPESAVLRKRRAKTVTKTSHGGRTTSSTSEDAGIVKPITSHPRVAAWLAPEGLIRNFVVVVSIVGEGRTPAGQLRVLRPSACFRVVERGGDPYIDPNSYEGYDGLTDSAASIDPAGAARLYATLNPSHRGGVP